MYKMYLWVQRAQLRLTLSQPQCLTADMIFYTCSSCGYGRYVMDTYLFERIAEGCHLKPGTKWSNTDNVCMGTM